MVLAPILEVYLLSITSNTLDTEALLSVSFTMCNAVFLLVKYSLALGFYMLISPYVWLLPVRYACTEVYNTVACETVIGKLLDKYKLHFFLHFIFSIQQDVFRNLLKDTTVDQEIICRTPGQEKTNEQELWTFYLFSWTQRNTLLGNELSHPTRMYLFF